MTAPSSPTAPRSSIIGGGVIGTSVAYHLTRLGWTDVRPARAGRALRRARRGTRPGWSASCAPPRAAPGSCSTPPSSTPRSRTRSGCRPGYKRCGGVTVARTEDRMTQLRRTAATADAFDLECELLTPEEARERYPVMRVDDLAGRDLAARRRQGQPDRPDQRAGARAPGNAGRRVVEHTRVIDVLRRGRPRHRRRAPTPATSRPRYVVNCAGQWAQGGRRDGRRRPCRCTPPSTSTSSPTRSRACTPTCRCCATPTATPTSRRRSAASSSAGSSPRPSRGCRRTRSPTRSSSSCSRRTGSTSRSLMDNAVLRVPALERDRDPQVLQRSRELHARTTSSSSARRPRCAGFFVGAGFNSVGIASAGGAGRALAEWIVEGEPTIDLTSVDIRRFAPFNGNNRWLHDRVGEVLGLHYESRGPTARCVRRGRSAARRSPPAWSRRTPTSAARWAGSAPTSSRLPGRRRTIEYSWGKQNWLPWSAAEQTSTRDRT